MVTPLVPNYKKNIGRLVADRYDFQNHIIGADFKHNAEQIVLSPPVIIESQPVSDIQEAITLLSNIITPIVIEDATTSNKGIIQLSGDIGGTATTITVTRLQNRSISTLTPNNGDVLTWNAGSSVWNPSPPSNTFTPGGDLSGSNINQQVISLTGTSGTITVFGDLINFDSGVAAEIAQSPTTIGNGVDFPIAAQSTLLNNGSGGNLILSGGNKGLGSGLLGGIHLKLGNGDTVLQLAEVATNRRVLSLLHTGSISTSDMPANTGNMVIYVRDTTTPPTSGSPTNGTIVYSSGGQLWVKQQDGNNFSVGSIPNPSIWGTTGQQTYTNRSYVTSNIGSAVNAFTFALPDNTSTKIDALFIAKGTGTADGASFNLSMGYVRNGGGAPVAMGSVTNADPRNTTGNAASWTAPNINLSGNNLQVLTGFSNSITIKWLVVVQLAISQG